jgi:replicative DNA helicase
MFATEGDIALSRLRKGPLQKPEISRLHNAAKRLAERQVWIEEGHPITIAAIAAKCRALKPNGLSVLLVDYLQLVTPTASRRDSSREREVAAISRELKSLALELGVVVLALSQVNEEGQLRESRAIGQDADIVLQIRQEAQNDAVIQIRKHRAGPRGAVPVVFHGDQLRFSERSDHSPPPNLTRFPHADAV